MNLGLLTNNMDVDRAVAVAFLNITPFRPALRHSSWPPSRTRYIPGQADFIIGDD